MWKGLTRASVMLTCVGMMLTQFFLYFNCYWIFTLHWAFNSADKLIIVFYHIHHTAIATTPFSVYVCSCSLPFSTSSSSSSSLSPSLYMKSRIILHTLLYIRERLTLAYYFNHKCICVEIAGVVCLSLTTYFN